MPKGWPNQIRDDFLSERKQNQSWRVWLFTITSSPEMDIILSLDRIIQQLTSGSPQKLAESLSQHDIK